MNSREKVETTNGQSVEPVLLSQLPQSEIDTIGAWQGLLYALHAGGLLRHRLWRGIHNGKKLADGYALKRDAKVLLHNSSIDMTGDEPVGRLPHYTKATLTKLTTSLLNSCQRPDSLCYILVAAMNNLATKALLAQIRQYLQRGGKGIAEP